MPRATLSLACLWWLTLVGAVAAQSDLTSDTGVVSLQNYSGGVSYGGTYFQVQNVTGNGVGWTNGYTQLGVLTPYWMNEDTVFAANGRMIVTDNQQIGGNLGGFARHYSSGMDRLFGFNAFYDIDESINDFKYRQTGIGVETLGQWWDFRANGYFPVTSGDNFVRPLALTNNLSYVGHQIAFAGTGLYEQALTGGDFEFGRPIFAATPWLRGYAGMYMYNSKGVDPVGFRGRIEGWISDDLSVGVMVTEDRQFNTNVNAVVNFLFSGWKPTRWFPNFTTRERMLMPVQRNWRIAAGTYEQYFNIAAINPRTNQPYFVDWVDNSSTTAGPGDGTYENPFKTLQPNFPNADMILVNRGNTSAVAPLTGSIALTDYQRLLGEGTVHQFETFANFGGLSIPLQTRNLPGFTNSGNLPYVSGGAGNFVTLANNNEVSSFNILNSAGAGVTNTPAGSNNFDLNHLNLTNNAGGGIMLTQATSTGLIRNVNATNNLAGGISVDSGVIPLTLLMDTVTSNGQAPGAQAFGIRLLADDSAIVASLNKVTTNGNTGNGIDLRETNVGMQAVLTNVTSTGNGGDGLRADANGNGLALSLNTVKTTSNTGRGIYVTGNNAYISFNYSALDDNFNGNDNLNFTLTNNSTLVGGGLNNTHFDSSTNGSGIVFNTDSGSRIGSATNYFNLRDVTANGNNQSGMQIIATNASQQFINVVNGFFNNNATLDGVTITENGGSGVVLNVDPTTLTGNGRDGLHFDVTGGSFLIGSFDQTQFNNNQNAGVYGIADSALVNLTFTASSMQNTVPFAAGAQDYGMQLNLSNMTQFAASITDGNITNNLQQGILLNLSGASPNDNSLALTNVQVNGNGLDGLKAAVQNTADLTISATSSSFSQNGLVGAGAGDGLDLSADTGSSLITSLTNSTVKQNSNQGILATANNTSLLGVLLDGTLVSQNSQNGISATANGGSGLGVITSNGTKIDDNALGGVIVTANASGFLGEFTDTSISHNLAGRGVSFTGSGATSSEITFEDSFVYHNQLDNFFFDVSGGHQLSLSSTNTNFSLSNTGRGINGHVTGAGSYVEMDPFLNNIADGNKLDGMQLLVDTNAQLLGNINGGSYSLNGGDGVHVAVTTGGDAVICFDGTRMNANADDGYDFSVNDAGSSLYVLLQTSGTYGTLSGSYNGDQAYTFNMGAGTDGGVFTSGANQFLFNRGATPISFTANGANSAAFSFSGTSNGNVGDGVSVQMSGVANAYIDIHDGEVSNNGGSGIDISLSSVTFSPTSLNILFPQSSTPFTVRGFNISNMIADANGEEGIKVIGTDVDMPAPGIMTVTGNTVTNSGQNVAADGILFNLSADSVINGLVFDGNVADNNNGDGIALIAANSSFGTLTFTNGGMHENAGHGLNLDLTATPITNLNITNNIQGINEQVGLQFQITGNTLTDPYSIVNTSSSGIDVTGFVININPSGNEWDTDSTTGTPFAPVSPTQTTTGLISVNGNAFPNSLPTGGVPDAQGILDLGFNNFNPGETFSWNIDADPIGGNDTVQGSELVGSTITVNFTGGLFLSGTLQPLGTDGSQFIATGGNISSPGASNNAGDGIHVSQAAGSNITNLNITGNQTNNNDGRGINLISSDSTITTANVNTNTATSNGSDGIQLDLTNTPITTLTLDRNTIAKNLGEGIAIGTNSNITTLHVTNNTVTDNLNNGVYLNFNTSNVNVLDVTGNTITGSGSTSGATPSNFNIDLVFTGGLTAAQQALVTAAAQRWEEIITGDLPNVGSIDDLQVTINVANIDGNLNVLANAGPTAERPVSFLPYQAVMNIDSSDLNFMQTNGIFQSVIEHELGHALGFGTIWTDRGLLTGAGGSDPEFTGANATAQYNSIFSNTATSVPVENTGGAGTADSHWRETVFNNELMTGFLNGTTQPISKVTVGQFQDLGYTVNYNSADTFTPSVVAPISGVRLGMLNQSVTIANASQVSVAPSLTSLVAPSSSAGDGIHIEMTNSNIASTNFTTNTINSNQANGINYAVVDNSTVGPVVVLGNNINSNGGDGFRMVDPDTVNTTLNLTYAGNTMNSNLGNGINLGISNGQHLVLAMPSGNTIGQSGAGNGEMGVRLDVSGTSSFAATIGTTGQIANNFGSNHDAGFGISMSDNSGNSVNPLLQNTLTVVNSNFTGTTDGSDANFSGQGLGVGLTENAVLTSMTLGDATVNNTTFSNGNVDGIGLLVDSSARVDNVNIRHVAANNNSNDGMNFFRQGDAQIVTTAVSNSSFNINRGNGVELTAAARDVADTYTFTDTTFNNNTDNGMQLNVIADGDLNVTVTRGTFSGNGNSGIEATRNADTTDTPEVILNVQDSTISSNQGDGIQMFDVRQGGNPFAVYDLTVNNTLISLNDRDGIHLRDPGISSITNNRILDNGDDGIDIRVDTNGGAITEIYGNTIQSNDSDGVQLVVQGDGAGGDFTVGGTGVGQANQILDNGGRGILLITAGGNNASSTITTADFSGNTIARNQLEGIYVVNTAANDQALEANVDNVTSDAMLTTDQLQNRPRTFLTINANTINSNGKTLDAGDFIGATGIVVRVGSSNASTSYTDNGGTFASGRGGVGATITGNTLHGNYGADVTFAPFISTTPPDQTQGTWSATEFTVDSFISDPLARLDLRFSGNTGDGLFATNTNGAADVANVFYNNDEGTFKSRTDDATDPGPFTDADRARNATRLGSRSAPDFDDPTTPGGASNTFNYSGVGGSTFRVNTTGTPNNFVTGGGSFGGSIPIDNSGVGEEPFVWGTLP